LKEDIEKLAWIEHGFSSNFLKQFKNHPPARDGFT
jgi:hypothetical protein